MDNFEAFMSTFFLSVKEDSFARLTLSKPIEPSAEVKKIIIRMVLIKEKRNFSFVYRHATKDITKNLTLEEGGDKIIQLLQTDFVIANLFTEQYHISMEKLENRKYNLKKQKQDGSIKATRDHDKQKKSLLAENNYLKALGILNQKGNVQKDKGDKLKQINKFVEIFDSILRKNDSLDKIDPMHIVDMGSGKGYLTFALYDYLTNTQKKSIVLRGIEMKSELVEICNNIATDVKFDQLTFEQGTIEETKLQSVDMLLALHACDTATDDAILKGIQADASLIMCAPCCHRQVRKAMKDVLTISSITQFGILKERQAELLTDTIRALILELNGYKTHIFEFISSEHTGKNLMITAIKHNGKVDKEKIQNEIDALKSSFGIKEHYLEEVLN